MPDTVTRNALVSSADGTTPPLRLNRQGNVVFADQYQQWIAEGRVYCSSDADGNDTVAAIATWVATTPQLILDVPVGTTIVPLWVNATNAGQATGDTGSFMIMYDGIDRYGSGGTLETTTNMRTDDPRSNTVDCRSTPTANAASSTGARLLYNQSFETNDGSTAGAGAVDNLIWSARTQFSPVLVGPAGFLVWFESSATTSFQWSIGWAEFLTTEVV